MINFYDTSALLNISQPFTGKAYISNIVFSELESIKNSQHKDNDVKLKARELIRNLINSNDFIIVHYPIKKINSMLKKYNFLSDINDHRLLCEALLLSEETNVTFVTSDAALYLFAKEFPQLHALYLPEEERDDDEEYDGWGKYFPDNNQMASLYSNLNYNILGAKHNEYCKIFEGDKLKDILRWDGKEYKNLSYKIFKSSLDEKIAPRNIEQKMLFDLLQNRNIPIKLCLGRYGSGKSFLMLAHALWLVSQGEFDKIVFVRNNIEVKDAGRIGFLPGTELEKTEPYIKPIEDHIGPILLESYLNEGIIEPLPLGFIRGRDIKNSIIFCDEAENMTRQHVQLLIGRISSNSELWLAGDLRQTDSITFEKNSGLRSLIQRLSGDELYGMVKLIKSERSLAAAKADLLD